MSANNDDTIDIELRSARHVAERCLILASLLRLSLVASTAPESTAEAVFDIREWLRSEGLWDAMTSTEQGMLRSLPASAGTDPPMDLAHLAVSFATLAWALALHDDGLTDIAGREQVELLESLPEPWDSTRSWIASAMLREEREIIGLRELADVLRWRLEAELARRGSHGRERQEIEQAIQDVIAEAVAAGMLSPSGPRDVRIDGRPVSALNEEDIASLVQLTIVRLRALNWICGFGANWESVPLDV